VPSGAGGTAAATVLRVESTAAVAALADALSRVVRFAALPRFGELIAGRAGTPLDRSAYVLLVNLLDGPLRIGDLAEALSLDVSTVSRQVGALETAGLARREPHPSDRRSSLVVISEAGAVAVDAHRRARRAVFAEVLDDVSDAELGQVTSVLNRLADRLEALAAA